MQKAERKKKTKKVCDIQKQTGSKKTCDIQKKRDKDRQG